VGAVRVQYRSAQVVPQLGSEADMQKQAIEQIRARVQYQKELMAAKEAHAHDDISEMWRWVNITFLVAIPICVVSTLYSAIFDEHPHRAEGELPEYMVIRNKEFPWQCGECDLFDMKCWKKCKANK
jgi:cytochrome c oxidase subunit 6a